MSLFSSQVRQPALESPGRHCAKFVRRLNATDGFILIEVDNLVRMAI